MRACTSWNQFRGMLDKALPKKMRIDDLPLFNPPPFFRLLNAAFAAQTRSNGIRLATPGYILYSIADGAHPRIDQPPPPTGLGLAASDVEELSALVNSRTPVTITD